MIFVDPAVIELWAPFTGCVGAVEASEQAATASTRHAKPSNFCCMKPPWEVGKHWSSENPADGILLNRRDNISMLRQGAGCTRGRNANKMIVVSPQVNLANLLQVCCFKATPCGVIPYLS